VSRVEVTDLIPGEAATSADVNATLDSWSTETAAGSINGDNVRMEGIDRRTLSAEEQVVFTEASGTFTRIIGSSGAVTSVGVYVVVPGPLDTSTDFTFAEDTELIVHATLYVESNPSTGLRRIRLIMQESDDSGGSWTDMVGTLQQ
jgi:hypothetical protein